MNGIDSVRARLALWPVLGAVVFTTGWSAAADTAAQATLPLEEVMVYAQKRVENVQDVPVAVSALSASDLRNSGLQTIERLTELHPSVSFDTAQSWQFSSLKIRGIGTVGNTRSFEGAVGVFSDGVYRARSGMALADLLDVDLLEVLRGPQSVLFGKNTVAGAIALRSTAPDPDGASGYLDVRLGNYDSIYATGAWNTPVSDSGALRVAAIHSQRDGFFASPDTGAQYDAVDRYGVKAQFLYRPAANLDVRIIADFSRSDAPCCWGSAQVVNGPLSPLIETYSALNGLTFVPAPASENDRSQSSNHNPGEKIDDAGIAALVNWDINDRWSFKSITALRNWEHNQINADPDYVPADLFILDEPADIDTLSQEFNIAYKSGPVDALLGVYLESEDYRSERSAATGRDADNYLNALISAGLGAVACLPPVVSTDCAFPVGINALLPLGEFTREVYTQDTSGLSLFTHLAYDATQRVRVVAGLRYDRIKKDGGVDNLFWSDSAIVRGALAAQGIADDGTPRNGLDLVGTVYSPSFTDATRDEEITGTLSVQYQLADSAMLYGGYSRGFKAGGVNLFREGQITNTVYAPEFADSIEAGIKAQYWGDRARTNVAVFDTRFSDLQINFFTGLEFRTENTGEASTRGIEIENRFRINDRLGLDLSAVYLDATFDRIDNPFLSYLVGRETPKAPRFSAVAAVDYERELPSGRAWFVRTLASYTGKHFVGADVIDEQRVGAHVITDANIGFVGLNGRWEASAWCTNCFDETYRTIYFNSTFQPGSFSAFLNDPRLFGVTFRRFF